MGTTLEYEIKGAHTGGNSTTVMIDSTASFIARRVHSGDIIYNVTDGQTATISSVDSATQLTCTVLSGAAAWNATDVYRIWVSEPNRIRHTYTDIRGYPASAEIMVCSPQDVAKDTYKDYQKIRLKDSDSSLIYFYGKIESGDSAFDAAYGQVINLFARDNLAELLKKVINRNISSIQRRGRAVAGPEGFHDGLNNAAALTDTTVNFVNLGVQVGDTLLNITDGSQTIITSISTTTNANDTLNGTLAGGTENDWDNVDPDIYEVEPGGMINLIIDGMVYSSGNIDTTDDSKFETSAVLESFHVLDSKFVGSGKTGLKTIQEFANEDPWDATPTGFGYDFYLDTTFASSTPAPDMHYFKRGTRPSGGASANGLTVELNATETTQRRSMFMDYHFPTATKELITQVKVDFVDDSQTSQTKTIYLLDVSTRVNAPFLIGSTITGSTSAVTAVVEYDGSTFICVSTLSGAGIWTIGETITAAGARSAVITRSPRQSYEQDIEVPLRGYGIADVSLARSRAAQLLYQGGNTITRGTFRIAGLPYFSIAAVYTQVRAGHLVNVTNSNLGLSNKEMLVTKITFDEGPGIQFSTIEVLDIDSGRGVGAEKGVLETIEEKNQTAITNSFVRSDSGAERVEITQNGLGIFGLNQLVKFVPGTGDVWYLYGTADGIRAEVLNFLSDGNIQFKSNAVHLLPNTAGNNDLGTAALYFGNIYIGTLGDFSAISAGNPTFKITATSDVPAVTWATAYSYVLTGDLIVGYTLTPTAIGVVPSVVPAGYIEILNGATPSYIPFWT